MTQNLDILWQQCATILRDIIKPSAYNTWFASLEAIEYAHDTLVLRVKSQFVAEYIEENYIDELSKVIWRVFGEKTRLEYRVLIDSTTGAATTYPSESHTHLPETIVHHSTPIAQTWDTQLNSYYSFSNFIAGESNRLARTAALAIAKEPGKTVFNPLFIYGGSGVGKTHLANAIGNEIMAHFPDKRVLYVSANTFKLQYQEAAKENKIPDFLLFYQAVDVLIVDDIQFFTGLKGTQDTFFHIFNFLHQSRKQLILTSDCSPLMLKDVEDRLLTRFKWGLPVEILRPDIALRKAILEDKIHRDGLTVSPEIIDYIAENACDNIRDIEGILASLLAYATLMNSEITMSLAENVVSKLVDAQPKSVMIEDIIGAVCEHSGISTKAITSKSRQKEIVRARQIIIFLCKKMTNLSLCEIGNLVGNRSHATIIHAINTMNEQMQYDRVLKHDISLIENDLK